MPENKEKSGQGQQGGKQGSSGSDSQKKSGSDSQSKGGRSGSSSNDR